MNGPASVRLVEGNATIFGCPLSHRKNIVIKSWRSRPVHSLTDCNIEYTFGEGGSIEEVEGNTIPDEWLNVSQVISSRDKVTVMVMGASDSGKTSLATLICNSLMLNNKDTVFFDLDLGQSNICSPTTIGYVRLKTPIPDLSYLRAENMDVVGYTSPTPLVLRHLEVAGKLYRKLKESYPDSSTVVDVDGWISGEAAIKHKIELMKILNPDFLLLISDTIKEIEEYCYENSIELRKLPPSITVRKRSLEARRKLREMMFERFLRKSILRTIPSTWIELKYINGEVRPHKLSSIINKLITKYSEENGIILEGGLEELFKEHRIGVLSYVYDTDYKFVSIGLLTSLNLEKKMLKIYTPFQQQIKQIVLTSILLSIDGAESYSTSPHQYYD